MKFDYERFKALAKERGVTQAFLCEAVGRQRFYIGDLKRGVNPKPEYTQKWAEMLGTTVEYLTGQTDKKEKPSGDMPEGLTGFNELTPENQAFIRKQIALLKALQSGE